MPTIYAIHAPDADRLAAITTEMETRGAPVIEVVDCGDHYMALEGSHRLAAAHALGLVPVLTIHEQDDVLDVSRFDWFEVSNWADPDVGYTAGEAAGELFSPHQAMPYSF